MILAKAHSASPGTIIRDVPTECAHGIVGFISSGSFLNTLLVCYLPWEAFPGFPAVENQAGGPLSLLPSTAVGFDPTLGLQPCLCVFAHLWTIRPFRARTTAPSALPSQGTERCPVPAIAQYVHGLRERQDAVFYFLCHHPGSFCIWRRRAHWGFDALVLSV